MRYRWMAALCAAGSLVAMSAKGAQYTCGSDLPDLGGASCMALIGDLVTPQFTNRYPANAYHFVVMAAAAHYDDGAVSGYALAGIAPAGQAFPDNPSIVHFSDGNGLDGAALANREKSALRRAVANLMKNLDVATPARRKR